MDVEYKFNYRFNPKSNRLESYDYSENWWYFITICTKDRQKYFGKIVDGEMVLNKYWKIVEMDIVNLEKYYSNVIISDFVVMPDHIHFNIFINNWIVKKDVSEKHLYTNDDKFSVKYYSNISPKKWELWNIIKLFKWYVTKKLNKINKKVFFSWQKNYYDRIIRNKEEFIKIQKYIKNNPKNWNKKKIIKNEY